MMLGGAITRRLIFAVVVCGGTVESFRVTETMLVPPALGVPVIFPLALIVKPRGSPVADQM